MLSTMSPVDALRSVLVRDRNPDGGWGYYAGKASRIEPTSWALLALMLDRADNASRAAAAQARAWLLRCQRSDGLLVDAATNSLNLAFNGLAALSLSGDEDPAGRAAAERVANALVEHRGLKAEQTEYFRQDNGLQGWPWIDNTFSWVEPTAWCLLAVKKTMRGRTTEAAGARIAEAERLLIDRTCQGGGWNYGNAHVLGKDLWAYVPTTAVGLMATQDQRHQAAVRRSAEYLDANRLSEPSGMALALTLIALEIHGVSTDSVQRTIKDQVNRLIEFGNLHVIALSLYALSPNQHGEQAFRL